jgi:hypothetical protein
MSSFKLSTPLHRTCQQAAVLMLVKEDRPLALKDRLALRLHLWICSACPHFQQQLDVMKRSLSDWRNGIAK